MKYRLKVYSILEYGQRVDSEGNPHQEDCIFPAYGQQKDSDRLFILCDGMGGHEAGEVASATVCSAMSQSVFESAPDAEGDFSDDNLSKAVTDAFNALDAISKDGANEEKKMGTTMTFLKFHNKGCTIAHMGDSRVYHIRPGKGRDDSKILFKTYDHSLVNDLIKIGELTPEEAKHSKQKNVITRAMQPYMKRQPKPDVYHTAEIKPGDYFYMCSDGMLEQMEDENILFNFSEATGDDENKVKILTQATSQNSDNHSAIIVHVLDVIDPLPIVKAAVVPTKPAPIMAQVDADSRDEDDEAKEFVENEKAKTGRTSDSQTTNNMSSKPERMNSVRPHEERVWGDKVQGMKNRKLFKYISLILFITMLVLGIYYISDRIKNCNECKTDKIENPQETSENNEERNNKTREPESPQPYGKQEDIFTPSQHEPVTQPEVPSSTSEHSPQTGPSQTSSTGNGTIGTSAQGEDATSHNPTRINQNHPIFHGDDVVSSDQQIAAETFNSLSKKNKNK